MQREPTSVQYALGVNIGKLVVDAMRQGATYGDVIDTLQHVTQITVRNQAFDIDLAADDACEGES